MKRILSTSLYKGFNVKAVLLCIIITVMCSFVLSDYVFAETIEENVQRADLIFIGTMYEELSHTSESKALIYTTAHFKDIEVIHAKSNSGQQSLPQIAIAYVGGTFNGLSLWVSGAPKFIEGQRYLIFMYDDGKLYLNPITGHEFGIFLVKKDMASGQEYILTRSNNAIMDISGGIISLSKRLVGIQNGNLVPDKGALSSSDRFRFTELPLPSQTDGINKAQHSDFIENKDTYSRPPYTVSEFSGFIRNLAKKMLSDVTTHNDNDSFLKAKDAPLYLEAPLSLRYLLSGKSGTQESVQSSACGATYLNSKFNYWSYARNLPVVFQMTPTTFKFYKYDVNAMAFYNNYVDIYRYTDSDGSAAGENGVSEYWGFPSTKSNGSAWGNAGAATFIWWGSDCKLTETDVMFNPNVSWYTDLNSSLGSSGYYYTASLMHELGHTVGLMLGDEGYNYDEPTVMHGMHNKLLLKGDLHPIDLFTLYSLYGSYAKYPTDVGVQSYYANNGLKTSTTNKSSYNSGEAITLYNVTVENNSATNVSNLNLQFFLCTSRDDTSTCYPQSLGNGTWYWTTFNAIHYVVSNYVTSIPSGIPSGTYYIMARVNIGGTEDSITVNNHTSFYSPIVVSGTTSGSYALTVTKSGTGSGTVAASSGTLSWSGNVGTASYTSGTSVVLTATANSGSTFTSWSGCNASSGSTCTVTMTSGKGVTATFTSSTAVCTGALPLYRFYKIDTDSHFWTIDVSEKDWIIKNLSNQYKYEGPTFYAYTTCTGASPLYRFYKIDTDSHFWTIDVSEKDWIIKNLSNQYKYEGPTFYAYTTCTGASPLYRFYKIDTDSHFWTIDVSEKDWIIKNLSNQYKYEGPTYYAITKP
ncbi:MAG: hypothetical protein HQL00_17155 [Nitrospirae bacterium]|nr:hypothetical protein [Nitrospirota bacterium]